MFNQVHHCGLYRLVDWRSLHTRRLQQLLVLYKSILGMTPRYLSNLLHISDSNRHCFIRLIIPKVRPNSPHPSQHIQT